MFNGVDYYPEHWERRRWRRDVKLMAEAGLNVVRMGEFAWSFMEPEEGVYDFSLFDEVLGLLGEHGVSAILGTPTAAMPAWIARKYPETLAQNPDGSRVVWGTRKSNCFTSGTYRLLSKRITEAMATHFAKAPNLIGWQTDNEFREPFCCCESCRQQWSEWLERKYGTLPELNRAWGTHFWGHTLRRWDEVLIPVDRMRHNPSACLDYQRFHSWLNVRFQRDQVNILRREAPNTFILHNLILGVFPEVNYFDLGEDLDQIGWDNYSVRGKPSVPYHSAFKGDLTRGIKKQNYWIMEQTAGAAGSFTFDRNPRPGEIRKVAYQQLAHGADHQVWFRWRTCTAGKEQYWHGVLGHDGKPGRRYRELARTIAEFHRLAPEIEGTTLQPQVAMIYDFDSLWATRIQPGFDENDYLRTQLLYYAALFRAGVNVDIIKPSDDYSAYKALFIPNLQVLPDETARRLDRYVKDGGVLLADCRTGVKDETNLCHARTLPGLLADALGIDIEEYEAVPTDLTYAVRGRNGLESDFTAQHYMDWLKPRRGTEILADYDQWHLEKFAAATRHSYGKGTAYYVGTRVREEIFYDRLIGHLVRTAGIESPMVPPPGVETTLRQKGKRRLLFLINHLEEPQTVQVPSGKKELIEEKTTGENLTLDAYGVAVVKL